MSNDVTTPDLVIIGLEADDKESACRQLAERLVQANRLSNIDDYLKAVAAREEHFPTGIEGGIAIPHAQSEYVSVASVVVGVSPSGVDFGAEDGKANLIFLIAAPSSSEGTHLQILSKLARKIMHDEFCDQLRAEKDPAQLAAVLTREVQES